MIAYYTKTIIIIVTKRMCQENTIKILSKSEEATDKIVICFFEGLLCSRSVDLQTGNATPLIIILTLKILGL
jgi:hypothetical protein